MDSASAAERNMKHVGRIVKGEIVWTKIEDPSPPPVVAPPPPAPIVAKVKKPPKPRPKAERFETNLTEALVGWKAWNVVGGFLQSTVFGHMIWKPDEPMVAKCANRAHKTIAPKQSCTCGIYAADTYNHITEFEGGNAVAGEVLGWGRYVRGEHGWRAQYVYPSRFLINRDSLHLLPSLMKYHVPIFCWEPKRIYDPREDGYQCDQGDEWNFTTSRDETASEDE